jgi:hypothetical protein
MLSITVNSAADILEGGKGVRNEWHCHIAVGAQVELGVAGICS